MTFIAYVENNNTKIEYDYIKSEENGALIYHLCSITIDNELVEFDEKYKSIEQMEKSVIKKYKEKNNN